MTINIVNVRDGYYVRKFTARQTVAFLDLVESTKGKESTQQSIRTMAHCCAFGILNEAGELVNASVDYWLDQDLELVNELGQAVLDHSGLNKGEDHEGN